jgi:hypothetical protein
MLTILRADDISYNSEYQVGIGVFNKDTNDYISTSQKAFNGILVNVDSESFWFRVDGKISKVKQDAIVWMIPMKEK